MLYHISESTASVDFCNSIIRNGESLNVSDAKIYEGNDRNRKSKISWIKNNNLQNQLGSLIKEINEKSNWNYSLKEFEPLQYTLYNVGDYYDWHIDTHSEPYENGLIRKLSFTLCLNDEYEGGNFSICVPHPISKKTKVEKFKKPKVGTLIVFPSHSWHKVDKVTSGVRKTLVGWVLGKKWS